VGSTYNYAAPLYHELIREFNKGNLTEASQLQQISINMAGLFGKYGGMATGKAYMKYVGIDCGQFRSPLKNMSDEMYNDFVTDVRDLEMDHWFSKK
jgi:N-acetylneuraminate lyase